MSSCSPLINIVEFMWDYQKKHSITRECITNAFYYKDQLNANSNSDFVATVKAVIMTSLDDENALTIVGGHLVVSIDAPNESSLVDPSYETHSKPRREYFTTVHDLLHRVPSFKTQGRVPATVEEFMAFCRIADKINAGEAISSLAYYNAQADYVLQRMQQMVECEEHRGVPL